MGAVCGSKANREAINQERQKRNTMESVESDDESEHLRNSVEHVETNNNKPNTQISINQQTEATKANEERPIYSKVAKYPDFNESLQTNAIAISKDEYVIPSTQCIYKYNANSNVWSIYLSYSKGFNAFGCFESCSCSFDPNTSTLFIMNRESILMTLRMNRLKTVKLHKLYSLRNKGTNENVTTIFIKDTLHIIGGTQSNKHYIFKPKLQRFKQIHVFKEHNAEYQNGFSSHSAVFIKSQNKLLLFGGCANFDCLDTIYSFCLYECKWTKLSKTLPIALKNAFCILSGNEKFILIFGGFVSGFYKKQNEDIYVMDVDTFQFRKCKIRRRELCNDDIIGCVAMTNVKYNERLIYACLNYIWRRLERNDKRFISEDCIKVILSYYGDGDIYIIDKKRNHRRVRADDIMQQLRECNEMT